MTDLELARLLLNLKRGPHLRKRVLSAVAQMEATAKTVRDLVPINPVGKRKV